jgi:hypothetical protein
VLPVTAAQWKTVLSFEAKPAKPAKSAKSVKSKA